MFLQGFLFKLTFVYSLLTDPKFSDPISLFSIVYNKWSVAFGGTVPSNGFVVDGSGLVSGLGSIEITTLLPDKSNGDFSPSGAFIKKSSPGN